MGKHGKFYLPLIFLLLFASKSYSQDVLTSTLISQFIKNLSPKKKVQLKQTFAIKTQTFEFNKDTKELFRIKRINKDSLYSFYFANNRLVLCNIASKKDKDNGEWFFFKDNKPVGTADKRSGNPIYVSSLIALSKELSEEAQDFYTHAERM